MATKLTVGMLEKKDACKDVVKKFKRKYPEGVYVTIKNIITALATFGCYDVDWIIAYFCHWHTHDKFNNEMIHHRLRTRSPKHLLNVSDRAEFAHAFLVAWNKRRK